MRYAPRARFRRVPPARRILTALLAAAALAFVATSVAAAGAKNPSTPHGPKVVLQIPWGAMGATVGRLDGNEGASEGPMSFAILPSGDVVVLDQVNQRLARFDATGILVADTPIVARTFQDLEVFADGTIVLLDRLARASLLVIDKSGAVIREVGLIGPGIQLGGSVTAMLAQPDGIWLEVGHEDRVQVLDAKLMPSPRTVLPGRPFSKDKHLLAALDAAGGARLWLEDAVQGTMAEHVEVRDAHTISRIIWVEADAAHNVHAMFHLLDFDPVDHAKVTFEAVLGVRYDASLGQTSTYQSPHVISDWEQFREFRLQSDGTIYQMAFDLSGVRILSWSW